MEGSSGAKLATSVRSLQEKAKRAVASAKLAKRVTKALKQKQLAKARKLRQVMRRGRKASFKLNALNAKMLTKESKKGDLKNEIQRLSAIDGRNRAARLRDRSEDVGGVKQESPSTLTQKEKLPTLQQAKSAVSVGHPCTVADVVEGDVVCETADSTRTTVNDELLQVDAGYVMLRARPAEKEVAKAVASMKKRSELSAKTMMNVERRLDSSRRVGQRMLRRAWKAAEETKHASIRRNADNVQSVLSDMRQRSLNSLAVDRAVKKEIKNDGTSVEKRVSRHVKGMRKRGEVKYDALMNSLGEQNDLEHNRVEASEDYMAQQAKDAHAMYHRELQAQDDAEQAIVTKDHIISKDVSDGVKYRKNLQMHELRAWNVAQRMMEHDQEAVDSFLP